MRFITSRNEADVVAIDAFADLYYTVEAFQSEDETVCKLGALTKRYLSSLLVHTSQRDRFKRRSLRLREQEKGQTKLMVKEIVGISNRHNK